jgi:hypothetical protein
MSIVRSCNCDPSQCKTSDLRKRVHVDDECYHANYIHHKIKLNFVNKTNPKDAKNDKDGI